MPTIKIKGEEIEIDFYKEEVGSKCVIVVDDDTEATCLKKPSYVSIDFSGDAICNTHRMEMTPGTRRRYVKIEDVPFKTPPRSASEVAFNGNEDPELDDEDFELSDEEAEAALVKGE
jgi:hypothetical protein